MDFKSEKTALFLHKKTSPAVASVLWAGLANVDQDISFSVLDAFSCVGNLEEYILRKKCETLAIALWIDEVAEAYTFRNLKRLDEADKEAVELYERGVDFIWYVSRTTLDILNILKVGGELPEYVSLEQLFQLAEIKGEKPAFLFPVVDPTEQPEPNQEEKPLTELPIYLQERLDRFIRITKGAYAFRKSSESAKKEEIMTHIKGNLGGTDIEAKIIDPMIRPPKG